MRRLGRVDPAIALAEAPFTLALCLVLEVVEDTGAVLDVILPLADETVAARPYLGATTFHFAGLELALVD